MPVVNAEGAEQESLPPCSPRLSGKRLSKGTCEGAYQRQLLAIAGAGPFFSKSESRNGSRWSWIASPVIVGGRSIISRAFFAERIGRWLSAWIRIRRYWRAARPLFAERLRS